MFEKCKFDTLSNFSVYSPSIKVSFLWANIQISWHHLQDLSGSDLDYLPALLSVLPYFSCCILYISLTQHFSVP